MERSEKKLAELGRVLAAGRPGEISERIRHLRAEAPFEGALRMLALYYDKSDDVSIKLKITGFFNDMKDSSGRAEVIESLAAVSRQDSVAMLASSCWQSGLDYSEYAIALADAFMTGDYMTSLECFTVLETCAGTISEGDRTEIILRLERVTGSFAVPMQKLANELIRVLKEQSFS